MAQKRKGHKPSRQTAAGAVNTGGLGVPVLRGSRKPQKGTSRAPKQLPERSTQATSACLSCAYYLKNIRESQIHMVAAFIGRQLIAVVRQDAPIFQRQVNIARHPVNHVSHVLLVA